eukprot:Clim_evm62s191 gene=Clim_evmTU62s191
MSKPVVIIGGGVAGLSMAYYLRTLPVKAGLVRPSVVLLESEQKDRFGGWLHSIKTDKGFTFDLGPRSFRPVGVVGLNLLDLAHQVGKADSVIGADDSDPASKDRYVYIKGKLNKLPNGPFDLLFRSNAASQGLLSAALKEPFKPRRLCSEYEDTETVFEFFERRFSNHVATYLADPLCHGVFANSARNLSLRSCFPILHTAEQMSGSVIKHFIGGNAKKLAEQEMVGWEPSSPEAAGLIDRITKKRAWSFKNGAGELAEGLYNFLKNDTGVQLRSGVKADYITINKAPPRQNKGGIVGLTTGEEVEGSTIVSAVSAFETGALIEKGMERADARHRLDNLALYLQTIRSITCGVVNIGYNKPVRTVLGDKRGFGYLIPDAEEQDALGVVFDTCTFPEVDNGEQMRLTVMMGGHRYTQKFGRAGDDEAQRRALEDAALKTIRNHLNIEAEPDDIVVNIQKDCIPTYSTGHKSNLIAIKRNLLNLNGALVIGGSSYQGPAVNDIVMNSRRSAQRILSDAYICTGLHGLGMMSGTTTKVV